MSRFWNAQPACSGTKSCDHVRVQVGVHSSRWMVVRSTWTLWSLRYLFFLYEIETDCSIPSCFFDHFWVFDCDSLLFGVSEKILPGNSFHGSIWGEKTLVDGAVKCSSHEHRSCRWPCLCTMCSHAPVHGRPEAIHSAARMCIFSK